VPIHEVPSGADCLHQIKNGSLSWYPQKSKIRTHYRFIFSNKVVNIQVGVAKFTFCNNKPHTHRILGGPVFFNGVSKLCFHHKFVASHYESIQ